MPCRVHRPSLCLLAGVQLTVATLASASRLSAQSCTTTDVSTSCNVTTTVSLPVPYVAELSSSTASTAVTLTSVNGTTNTVGPQITARANAAYSVALRAGASTWTFSGIGTNPSKAATDLAYQTSATSTFVNPGTFTTISTAGATLMTGAAAAQSSIYLRWRTSWSWTASKPGTYTLPITFTLTAP